MIFGGTAVQTVILAVITIRCDWEDEVQYPDDNRIDVNSDDVFLKR